MFEYIRHMIAYKRDVSLFTKYQNRIINLEIGLYAFSKYAKRELQDETDLNKEILPDIKVRDFIRAKHLLKNWNIA